MSVVQSLRVSEDEPHGVGDLQPSALSAIHREAKAKRGSNKQADQRSCLAMSTIRTFSMPCGTTFFRFISTMERTDS